MRHHFSATLLFSDILRDAGLRWGPNRVFGGCTLSSKWFLPYRITFHCHRSGARPGDWRDTTRNRDGYLRMATDYVPNTCTHAVNAPCLSSTQFAPSAVLTGSPTGLGTTARNSVYRPHFFDMDIPLSNRVAVTEHVNLTFGAQAYKAFIHTNFDQPVGDISNPQFGSSIAALGPPTSLLGSFVGAGSSPRLAEIRGVLLF